MVLTRIYLFCTSKILETVKPKINLISLFRGNLWKILDPKWNWVFLIFRILHSAPWHETEETLVAWLVIKSRRCPVCRAHSVRSNRNEESFACSSPLPSPSSRNVSKDLWQWSLQWLPCVDLSPPALSNLILAFCLRLVLGAFAAGWGRKLWFFAIFHKKTGVAPKIEC